jgi:hypothetical protein
VLDDGADWALPPVAGFILRAHRKARMDVLVALALLVVALFLTSGLYHPY